jgi:hypothetical protein
MVAPVVHASRPTRGSENHLAAALEAIARHSRPIEDLIADWQQDPEMRAEIETRDAVREYGRVEVTIRNVISTRGSLRREFTDVDDARQFAKDHKCYYNNTEVRVAYVRGYETRTELRVAYPHSWYAPMAPRLVRYSVWRDVPGWQTGEPDQLRQEVVEEGVHEPD